MKKKLTNLLWILVSVLGFIVLMCELIALADIYNVPM